MISETSLTSSTISEKNDKQEYIYTLMKLFLGRRREFEELAFPTRSRVGWSNNIDETVDCLSVETGCF